VVRKPLLTLLVVLGLASRAYLVDLFDFSILAFMASASLGKARGWRDTLANGGSAT
jgi:hypothetical protein